MRTDLAIAGFIGGMRTAMIAACGSSHRHGRRWGCRLVLFLVPTATVAAAAAGGMFSSIRGALAALFIFKKCGMRQVGENGQGFVCY